MKILIMTQYFYPETFRVNTLVKELVNRGHEVTVLTGYPQYPYGKIYDGYGFNKPYEKTYNGAKIERIKMLPRGKTPIGLLLNCISFVTEGNKWVKKCTEKYDAIYVFEVSPVTVGLPAVTYKKKFGTPIFFNMQDLWPENVEIIMGVKNKLVLNYIDKIVDKIYENSDKILCTSNAFVKYLEKRVLDKEKLKCWHQFCESPDFSSMTKPEILCTDTFNIVFTGNIGKAQNLDLLINAINVVKNENIDCYLVGDGRALDELKKQVSSLNLSEKVHFIGRVSEKEANEYVYFADVCFMSLADNKIMDMTIPAKFQTYLSCGTPILGALNGECAEIIKQNNCGICTSKEPQDVANAILEFIKMEKSEIENIKSNALSYFENNFKKEKIVDELEEIMMECIYENTTN